MQTALADREPAARRRRCLAALVGAGLVGLALIAAAPHTAGAAAEKKKGGGVSYIQFPTLFATIRRLNGRRGVMSIEAGVDVPDATLHNRADQSHPILRDAYSRWLAIYGAALTPGAAPNAEEIKTELQRTTDRLLGRSGARFLIGTVMVN